MIQPIKIYNLTDRTAYKLQLKMNKIVALKQWFKDKFTPQQWEALKSTIRWVIFLTASDIVTQLMAQVSLIPNTISIKVWVLTYTIPLRFLFSTGLTLSLHYIDKLKHLNWKRKFPTSKKTGGILPL